MTTVPRPRRWTLTRWHGALHATTPQHNIIADGDGITIEAPGRWRWTWWLPTRQHPTGRISKERLG